MPTVSCPFRSSSTWIDNREVRSLTVFSRVRAEADPDVVVRDVNRVAAGLRSGYPEAYQVFDKQHEISATPLREDLTQAARPTLLVLLGTVGLVLLIASANVANLTLSNVVRREREMAVRAAIGASRGRLTRQLITESTLLSLLGGALGLVVAFGGLDLLIAFAERFTPRAREIHIDGSVLAFTFVVSVSTGIVFGLVPMIPGRLAQAGGLGSRGTGANSNARNVWLRHILIVSQLALSFTLLIGAGLMVRTLGKLQAVDPGFSPGQIVTMRLAIPFTRQPEAQRLFIDNLLDGVDALPGVQSVATSTAFPLSQYSTRFTNRFEKDGERIESLLDRPQADVLLVSPAYFATIGQPVLYGRAFDERDRFGAPAAAIVNQSLVTRHFGEGDVVGRTLSIDGGANWMEIVGVVGDVRQRGLDVAVQDEIYLSGLAFWASNITLLAQSPTAPDALARKVREVIKRLDPDVPVTDVATFEQVREEALASPRLTTELLGLFALLALIITAAGIIGVLGFSVSQRTQEIGVRMALGASGGSVLGMIVRQGLALVGVGLAFGVAGAVLFARVLSGLVFGVSVTDPVTFVGVGTVITLVAIGAIMVPARRATQVDPLTALRS